MKTTLLFLAFLGVAGGAFAQDATARVELGAQLRGSGLFVNWTAPAMLEAPSGFGATADVFFIPKLALEAGITWFPTREQQELQSQGGRTLEAALGLRAKLVTSKRFSLSVAFTPGIIHFTDAIVDVTDTFVEGPTTHPTLRGSAGIELYPSPRWKVGVDFGDTIYWTHHFEQYEQTPYGRFLEMSVPGARYDLDEITLHVGYRLGELRRVPDARPPGEDAHRVHSFTDLPDLVLMSAEVASLYGDVICTERAYKRSPDTFAEKDPIARPFVKAGWPGALMGAAIFATGAITVQYMLHRTNHHRIERLLAIVLTAQEARAAIDNAHALSEEGP